MLIIHILQQSTKLICSSAWITWFEHITRRCLHLLPPNSLLRQRWQRLLKRLPRLRSGWRKYGSASTKNTLADTAAQPLAAISLKTRPSGNGQTLCKVWLASVERCRCGNEAKTWKPLKLAGVPKLTKRSQPLVGWSSPYCGDMWRRFAA